MLDLALYQLAWSSLSLGLAIRWTCSISFNVIYGFMRSFVTPRCIIYCILFSIYLFQIWKYREGLKHSFNSSPICRDSNQCSCEWLVLALWVLVSCSPSSESSCVSSHHTSTDAGKAEVGMLEILQQTRILLKQARAEKETKRIDCQRQAGLV